MAGALDFMELVFYWVLLVLSRTMFVSYIISHCFPFLLCRYDIYVLSIWFVLFVWLAMRHTLWSSLRAGRKRDTPESRCAPWPQWCSPCVSKSSPALFPAPTPPPSTTPNSAHPVIFRPPSAPVPLTKRLSPPYGMGYHLIPSMDMEEDPDNFQPCKKLTQWAALCKYRAFKCQD